MREDGTILASSTFEYPLECPRPGWSQQNPDDWWEASVKGVRAVLKAGQIKPNSVKGIGLSGQMPALFSLTDRIGLFVRRCCGTISAP